MNGKITCYTEEWEKFLEGMGCIDRVKKVYNIDFRTETEGRKTIIHLKCSDNEWQDLMAIIGGAKKWEPENQV
ncbi:MAG: hypothetical protein ABIE43_05370 [Patescibacteria group bacterium]